MEENKNDLWETTDNKAENEPINENQTDFSEEIDHVMEQTKEDVKESFGLEDHMQEELDNLAATTDILAQEQKEAEKNAQAPVLNFGTDNIAQELHQAEKMAQQDYQPLSGQNPANTLPQQPPAPMGASGYNVGSNQPLQPNQYNQPMAPNVPPQQYNQQQNPSVAPVNNGNQQYGQQGQPYQGAPEYQDHSVFYQNQTGQPQGQQPNPYNQQQYTQQTGQPQGQQSNPYNQQQYTQQTGQPQQNYQNNQYYPPTQKPATDGLAIASIVLGVFSIIGNFAMDMMGLGFIAGIVGLILGIVSRNKNKNSKALIGIILNAVGLTITVVMLIACLACLGNLMSYGYDSIDPWSYF